MEKLFKIIFISAVLLFSFLIPFKTNAEVLNTSKELETFKPKVDEKRLKIKNVNGLKLKKEDINNLLSLSFTENEIINMGQEEYDLNKGLKGEEVTRVNQYLKIIEEVNPLTKNQFSISEENNDIITTVVEIDEDTYNKESTQAQNGISTMAAQDSMTTAYKKMTTMINKLGTNKYRVKNFVTWTKLPANRKIDILGIGVNTSWVPVAGTGYGSQSITSYSINGGYSSKTYTIPSNDKRWTKSVSGYAIQITLPKDDFSNGANSQKVTALSSAIYYDITNTTTAKIVDAFGHYAHQTTQFDISPGVDFKGGGSISISFSDKYSMHPGTHAQVSN